MPGTTQPVPASAACWSTSRARSGSSRSQLGWRSVPSSPTVSSMRGSDVRAARRTSRTATGPSPSPRARELHARRRRRIGREARAEPVAQERVERAEPQPARARARPSPRSSSSSIHVSFPAEKYGSIGSPLRARDLLVESGRGQPLEHLHRALVLPHDVRRQRLAGLRVPRDHRLALMVESARDHLARTLPTAPRRPTRRPRSRRPLPTAPPSPVAGAASGCVASPTRAAAAPRRRARPSRRSCRRRGRAAAARSCAPRPVRGRARPPRLGRGGGGPGRNGCSSPSSTPASPSSSMTCSAMPRHADRPVERIAADVDHARLHARALDQVVDASARRAQAGVRGDRLGAAQSRDEVARLAEHLVARRRPHRPVALVLAGRAPSGPATSFPSTVGNTSTPFVPALGTGKPDHARAAPGRAARTRRTRPCADRS